MIYDTQSAQISQKQDERNIYSIVKTMAPSGYYHSGFVATHALGHKFINQMFSIFLTINLFANTIVLFVYVYRLSSVYK